MSFLTTSWVSAEEYNGTLDLFESSPVLKPYFDNSFGYAVFPRVGKGGVIFGASHGKGKVYRLGEVVGSVELNEFTLGFQFGGQSFSEIIFFQDEGVQNSINKSWFVSILIILFVQMVDIQYFDIRISMAIWILLSGLKTLKQVF